MADSFVGGQLRSVAAAATDDLTIPLPFVQGKSNYLTSFTVVVDDGTWTGFGGTVNANGPHMFGVEVWLKRKEQKLLLDKGWAIYDCKYQRTVVGFAGRINFKDQDVIFVAVKNAGAITSAWTATGTVDVCESPVNETDEINRLHDDVSWIVNDRQVWTQANVAGGAQIIDIGFATGQVGRLISLQAYVSGTSGLFGDITDEDLAVAIRLGTIGSIASANLNLPATGAIATGASYTTGNAPNSTNILLGGGNGLTITEVGASIANHTLTIALQIELLNDPTYPTFSKARSTNAADVTSGGNSISVANRLQPIVRPRMIG